MIQILTIFMLCCISFALIAINKSLVKISKELTYFNEIHVAELKRAGTAVPGRD